MNCPTCGRKMAHFKYKTDSGSVVESWKCLHLIAHANIGDYRFRNMGGKRKGAGRPKKNKEEE